MAAADLIKQIFRPSLTVGVVYARVYGSNDARLPIGNVLELTVAHSEDKQQHADMQRGGGGIAYELRRVKESTVSMKLADLNATNLARATQSVLRGVESGTVTNEAHTATLGGLLRIAHISPTSVIVKVGATAQDATAVALLGNYEVRAAGIYLLPDAVGIEDGDQLWISYSYGAYMVMEALAASAVELELTFEGMNEADSDKPQIVEIWRASQGVTKSLALISGKLGVLDVEGTLLADQTKTGVGISRYYRVSMG